MLRSVATIERATSTRRVVVRRPAVHGHGVFVAQFLHTGERIFEYKGEVITWQSATQRYEHRDDDGHTFLFGLSDGMVIDGGRGSNSARWLNRACAPNCAAIETDGRVFVNAVCDIQSGEELLIVYALEIDGSTTHYDRTAYRYRCGMSACRGTMLSSA
ncbi:MAG: SET domain-containing protein-lysine N-methyltransferase [Burkholderia cenocepacia]